MNDVWEEEIKRFLGVNFAYRTNQVEIYKEALTHSSCGQRNNRRLAYLGDSVLRLIIREHCFIECSKGDKGDFITKCNEIERNPNLLKIASSLNLIRYMIFGKDFNLPDDLEMARIKGEALEALFGAIYLDQGFYKTKEIARKLKII